MNLMKMHKKTSAKLTEQLGCIDVDRFTQCL